MSDNAIKLLLIDTSNLHEDPTKMVIRLTPPLPTNTTELHQLLFKRFATAAGGSFSDQTHELILLDDESQEEEGPLTAASQLYNGRRLLVKSWLFQLPSEKVRKEKRKKTESGPLVINHHTLKAKLKDDPLYVQKMEQKEKENKKKQEEKKQAKKEKVVEKKKVVESKKQKKHSGEGGGVAIPEGQRQAPLPAASLLPSMPPQQFPAEHIQQIQTNAAAPWFPNQHQYGGGGGPSYASQPQATMFQHHQGYSTPGGGHHFAGHQTLQHQFSPPQMAMGWSPPVVVGFHHHHHHHHFFNPQLQQQQQPPFQCPQQPGHHNTHDINPTQLELSSSLPLPQQPQQQLHHVHVGHSPPAASSSPSVPSKIRAAASTPTPTVRQGTKKDEDFFAFLQRAKLEKRDEHFDKLPQRVREKVLMCVLNTIRRITGGNTTLDENRATEHVMNVLLKEEFYEMHLHSVDPSVALYAAWCRGLIETKHEGVVYKRMEVRITRAFRDVVGVQTINETISDDDLLGAVFAVLSSDYFPNIAKGESRGFVVAAGAAATTSSNNDKHGRLLLAAPKSGVMKHLRRRSCFQNVDIEAKVGDGVLSETLTSVVTTAVQLLLQHLVGEGAQQQQQYQQFVSMQPFVERLRSTTAATPSDENNHQSAQHPVKWGSTNAPLPPVDKNDTKLVAQVITSLETWRELIRWCQSRGLLMVAAGTTNSSVEQKKDGTNTTATSLLPRAKLSQWCFLSPFDDLIVKPFCQADVRAGKGSVKQDALRVLAMVRKRSDLLDMLLHSPHGLPLQAFYDACQMVPIFLGSPASASMSFRWCLQYLVSIQLLYMYCDSSGTTDQTEEQKHSYDDEMGDDDVVGDASTNRSTTLQVFKRKHTKSLTPSPINFQRTILRASGALRESVLGLRSSSSFVAPMKMNPALTSCAKLTVSALLQGVPSDERHDVAEKGGKKSEECYLKKQAFLCSGVLLGYAVATRCQLNDDSEGALTHHSKKEDFVPINKSWVGAEALWANMLWPHYDGDNSSAPVTAASSKALDFVADRVKATKKTFIFAQESGLITFNSSTQDFRVVRGVFDAMYYTFLRRLQAICTDSFPGEFSHRFYKVKFVGNEEIAWEKSTAKVDIRKAKANVRARKKVSGGGLNIADAINDEDEYRPKMSKPDGTKKDSDDETDDVHCLPDDVEFTHFAKFGFMERAKMDQIVTIEPFPLCTVEVNDERMNAVLSCLANDPDVVARIEECAKFQQEEEEKEEDAEYDAPIFSDRYSWMNVPLGRTNARQWEGPTAAVDCSDSDNDEVLIDDPQDASVGRTATCPQRAPSVAASIGGGGGSAGGTVVAHVEDNCSGSSDDDGLFWEDSGM